MRFKRERHDGLFAVINRNGKNKIVFTSGIFETTDKEEIAYLADMGYAHDGEEPQVIVSFDYAVRKLDELGKYTGRALKVCDEQTQAEDYMLDNKLDLDKHGIEERERK